MTNSTKKIQERYGKVLDQYSETHTPLAFDFDGSAPQMIGEDSETPLADRLYGQDELVDLPDSVTDVSLGCGNPLVGISLQGGETVLDLGSGGGIDCFIAAKAVGPTGYVIGVDATEKMITLANQNKEKMGVTNVEFRQGQIESLPVESHSVDVITSNCVIDISADKTAVFSEAFRVLKPGGRLTISDTVIEGEFPPNIKANVDLWAGAVITPLISHEAFLTFIQAAGFTNIDVQSRVSYGLENIEALSDYDRDILTKDVDWSTVPDDAGLYSIRVVARKPA